MAKQWHPFFSEMIKKSLEPKGFKVETEVEVGKLPLKIDLLVIKKEKEADVRSLPLVFQSFTDYNILEYKSPDDRFRTDDFDRLFAYALLFKIKEKIKLRRHVNTYALVSGSIKGIETYVRKNGHELVKIKDGLYFADFGFNFYLIQLDHLEISPENYHLILFTSGESIKELVKRIKGVSEEEGTLELIETGLYLHSDEFKEVKIMPQTLADRPDIIAELAEKVGVDIFVRGIGEDKVIRSIGKDKVIQKLGEDKVLDALIKMLGKEKIRKRLEEK